MLLTASADTDRSVPEVNRRAFDGIVCFGGVDWWYHNRGHYDLQMMRELSQHVPVLYVNSLGMRVPQLTEGRMFVRRLARKFSSLRKGLHRVHPRFAVLSPPSLPGRWASAAMQSVVLRSVRQACETVGISRPLVWVACPPAASIAASLDGVGMVYQRTDRMEEFPSAPTDFIRRQDADLKRRSDVTVFCSRSLCMEESPGCRDAALIDHGVDYDTFRVAGDGAEIPDDVASLGAPRIGYVGGIDAHTLDASLL
ncbi:MAG: glycosyltransferase family protein, partial [Planctomycetota bacterium]